jgi:hypothetical protein
MVPREAVVYVHVGAGVSYQPHGSARLLTPTDPCMDTRKVCINNLQEGYRVTAAPQSGYGPVASLVLPDAVVSPTRIDLWAHPYGADLTLDRYRVSRWTDRRQEVFIRHDAGYARYDIAAGQPFGDVAYQVDVGNGVLIELLPGGSYSINVPRDENGQLVRSRVSDSSTPMLVEVAARTGAAIVRSATAQVAIRPGEKLDVDMAGMIGVPHDATWQLIADGTFTRYTSTEYNRPEGTETWSISTSVGDQVMTPAEKNGIFSTVRACPPEKVDLCDPQEYVSIAQFRREGGQTKLYITGITQTLDTDVSEFPRLHFSAWVRVLNQSVERAGVQGSECPIMIYISYKQTNPIEAPRQYAKCVYTGEETPVKSPGINYERVPPYVWRRLDIDLRALPEFQQVRYLERIRIEARGHDYLCEFTDLSLVGVQ